MIKNRLIGAALLAVLLFIFIWTNEKLSFFILVLSCIMIGLSLICSIVGSRKLQAEVYTRGVQEGSEEDKNQPTNGYIQVHLKNRSIVPLFQVKLRFVIRNLLTGSIKAVERFYFLMPREEKDERIYLESQFIGRVETDIVTLESIDALGLISNSVRSASKGSFDKYPALYGMDAELEQSKPENQKSMERYLHRKGNDPSEVLDIREYRRGDNVKRIHWKLSARMRQTMVRELDMPSDHDTLLVFGIEGEPDGSMIDKVTGFMLNLSWNLLKQDVHHNLILLDESGYLIQNYDVTSQEDYGHVEQRVLQGDINVSSEYMNHYFEQNYLLGKYSHIIYVTDREPSYRLSESVDYMIP